MGQAPAFPFVMELADLAQIPLVVDKARVAALSKTLNTPANENSNRGARKYPDHFELSFTRKGLIQNPIRSGGARLAKLIDANVIRPALRTGCAFIIPAAAGGDAAVDGRAKILKMEIAGSGVDE